MNPSFYNLFRYNFYILIVGLGMIAPTNFCLGQSNYEKNLRFRAEDFFSAGLYAQALEDYLKLDSLRPQNTDTKYRIGLCYLNYSPKSKALPYLIEAQNLNIKTSGFDFNLGKAYHARHEFDSAIIILEKVRKQIADSLTAGKERHLQILNVLQQCRNGTKLKLNAELVKITNLGNGINTKYPEYSPLLTADEQSLIFTSCRPFKTATLDTKTGGYFEDLWSSQKPADKWDTAKNIGSPVNTSYHDASAALSADGQTLVIYRNENLYISYLKGALWTVPILLPKTINTAAWESSASFSADGAYLYFSSNKKGGFGGKDIYRSLRKANGEWGPAENLGSKVNTMADEEAPFIHPDNQTLYFSSDRLESIGGFDIFYSKKDGLGKWENPTNIGFPINSSEDDLDFVWSADGKRGYFSSTRDGGYGQEDIYMVERSVSPTNLLLLVGTISGKGSKSINAEIKLIDLASGKTLASATNNSVSGKYTLLLPAKARYAIHIEAPAFLPYSENLLLDSISPNQFTEIKKDFELQPLQLGSTTVLRNIFFDTNKADLKPESLPELLGLVTFLTQNKTLYIKIVGHTDNVGDEEHNIKLSLERAEAVVSYLVKQGISKNRLSTNGYGSKKSVAANNTENGRQRNRRIEIEVVQ